MREETRFFDRITSIELIFNGFKCGWKWFQSERLAGSVKKCAPGTLLVPISDGKRRADERGGNSEKKKNNKNNTPFNYRLVICTGACMEVKAATVYPAKNLSICCPPPHPEEIVVRSVRTGSRFAGQARSCFNRTKFGQCFQPWRT